jgi:uncharacterized phage infection (PIP) family protein YhgE
LQVISQGLQVISQGLQVISQGLQVISQGLQVISQGLQVISQGLQAISQGLQSLSQGLWGADKHKTFFCNAKLRKYNRDAGERPAHGPQVEMFATGYPVSSDKFGGLNSGFGAKFSDFRRGVATTRSLRVRRLQAGKCF